MVNLEYYKVFYHVAKLKSVTLAAEALFISQPAVSQAIKHLEKELGGSLFLRTPKGVQLTSEGEILHSYVSQGYEFLVQAENKYRELNMLDAGELRIGASDMTLQFYLLPHLERFHQQYPKIRIKVTNGPTPETLKYLHSGKIDFAVVSSPVIKELDQDLKYNDPEYKYMEFLPVRQITDIFIAGSRFYHLKDRTISVEELKDYPLICLEPNTSTRKYMDAFCESGGLKLMPEFELATSELIVQFTARNLGIGLVVKDFAKRLLTERKIFEVHLKTPVPTRDICVVTCRKTPITPAGKRFLGGLAAN